jgi:hypothetical protein
MIGISGRKYFSQYTYEKGMMIRKERIERFIKRAKSLDLFLNRR